jgi:3-methylcrotonyl-CoA carboxylase beta subunit
VNKIESSLNPRSDDYRANRTAMLALVEQLETRQAQVRAGGGERGEAKFREPANCCPANGWNCCWTPTPPF